MLNKIAGMNITYFRYSLEYFIQSMKRLDITNIELWGGAPHFFVEDQNHYKIKQLLNIIKQNKINLICFTPEQCIYPYDLSSDDEMLRNRTINYFSKCIDICNSLEVEKMVITSGLGRKDIDNKVSWKYSQEGLYFLAKKAESNGVYLMLEPLSRYESNTVTNKNKLKKMIAEIDNFYIKPMVDTIPMFLEKETLEDYFNEFQEDLQHIHLIDTQNYTYDHLAWGDGVLNLENYLNTIKSFKYEGYMTLEIIGDQYMEHPEKAFKKSIEEIKKIENQQF